MCKLSKLQIRCLCHRRLFDASPNSQGEMEIKCEKCGRIMQVQLAPGEVAVRELPKVKVALASDRKTPPRSE